MMEVIPDIGRNPDYGLAEDPEFKVKSVNFGDGFVQSQPDGLNSVKRVWSLTWGDLSEAEKDLLYDFFISRKGVYSFLWIKPLTNEAVPVVCRKPPSLSYADYDQYSLNVKLEEDFSP